MCAVVLATATVAAACGDDDPDDSMDPDDGPYSSPADFDRADCDGAMPLDTIDPDGIWHADMFFPEFGYSTGAIRYDADGAGGFDGMVFGRPDAEVSLTATDLFTRSTWTTTDGAKRTRSLDACRVIDADTVAGNYASCTNDECFLATFTLHRVEPIAGEPVADGLTLLAEFAGGDAPWPTNAITANVRQRDGVAYLARFGDGLRIVDVSNPQSPQHLGHAPVALPESNESYNDVKIVDGAGGARFALMASTRRGVVVVDVTDPTQPVDVTTFGTPVPGEPTVNVHTLFVEGDRAYLANVSLVSLEIYDIADPTAPQSLGIFTDERVGTQGGYLHDLFVRNGRVYLCYWNLGLVIVDTLANPAQPTVVGVFDDYQRRTSHSVWVFEVDGRDVAIHGDEDFGAHVRVVDVDDASPERLTEIGSWQTRPEVSVHNIMAAGDYALMTYYQDGVRVLDVSNPSQPVEVAHYATWPGAEPGYGASLFEGAIGVDFDAATDTVYVADTHRGLLILRLDR